MITCGIEPEGLFHRAKNWQQWHCHSFKTNSPSYFSLVCFVLVILIFSTSQETDLFVFSEALLNLNSVNVTINCTLTVDGYTLSQWAVELRWCLWCQVDAALLNKIVVSTLLIWGSNDSFLEKEMAEMSSQFVEDLTVKFIESAHHFVQQEEPQQVNLLMRQFLRA